MSFVAAAIIGSGALSAGASIFGASKASKAQQQAAMMAIAEQRRAENVIRGDLEPYREAGEAATAELQERLPFLTSPIEMTQENLEKTPGYQFTREQGLKATQNAAAARGLGVSGAALKGAATFATGLANQTYKDQFALENINRENAYTRLMGVITAGQNAAARTGAATMTAAGKASDALIGSGNAQAAAWNTAGQAASKMASDIGGYAMYKGIFGNNNWGGGGKAGEA
jgi:uncharacterized protein CbrC (UPF0167 family)